MTNFVTAPIKTTTEQAPTYEGPVFDEFWPTPNVLIFRRSERVDSTISDERVNVALSLAVVAVNKDLNKWKSAQTVALLSEMDENGVIAFHYLASVYSLAKALTIEVVRDYDTTKSGHQRADELEEKIDDYRRRSLESRAAILQISARITELI